jgi:hypothetical protein
MLSGIPTVSAARRSHLLRKCFVKYHPTASTKRYPVNVVMLTLKEGPPPLAEEFISLDPKPLDCPEAKEGSESLSALRFDSRPFPSSSSWGRLRGET